MALGFGKRLNPGNMALGFGKRLQPGQMALGFGKRLQPGQMALGFGKRFASEGEFESAFDDRPFDANYLPRFGKK